MAARLAHHTPLSLDSLPASLKAAQLLDTGIGYRRDGHVTFSNAAAAGMTLDKVAEQLHALHRMMDPQDMQRKPSTCHIGWHGDSTDGTGAHTLRFIDPATGMSEPVRFTRNALRQMASRILPARGLGFLEGLDQLGGHGPELAQVNLSMFSRSADTPLQWRTANLPDEQGLWRRHVRGVVSTSYAETSDCQLVDALLQAPEFAQLPVLSASVTDTGTRIRLSLDPAAELKPGVRVPMVELWNSEVGCRSVRLRPGMFTVQCLNGLHLVHGGGRESEYRWAHTGDPERIIKGLRGAADEVLLEARGVMKLYDKAMHTRIDNMVEFMQGELQGTMTRSQLTASISALTDPTNTPGSTLATVIDAVTVAAQSVSMFEQETMEQAAGRLLGHAWSSIA